MKPLCGIQNSFSSTPIENRICIWDEYNRQFIMDYEFYLKSVRRCNHNSATKYLKNFKKIVRLALDKEWLEKDPFAGVKFKFEQVDRDFLEMHEVEKLLQKQIDIPRMAQVWDVFAFCCFTASPSPT